MERDCVVVPEPLAVIDTVDVPAGVVGPPPPPQAESMTDVARVAKSTVAHNERRASGPRRLLFQKRMRPAMHAGIPAREAKEAEDPRDWGCTRPAMLGVETSVAMVKLVVERAFDPSAVSVAGVKAQVAFCGRPVQEKVVDPV